MRALRFLCRESGRLPSSWFLKAVVDASVLPSSSGFSDVYHGHLGEDRVALKVLKVHVDDHAKVRKVGDTLMIMTLPLANKFSPSGILSRGRDLEII